ncbi:MAG: hypothetical protein Q9167_008096, partial [Letrouitia subvulpina]
SFRSTMARHKVLHYNPQAASSTSKSPSAKEHGSTGEYYNRRYKEVDKKRRCMRLYEDSTESYRDRMEKLWREYVTCGRPHLPSFPLLTRDVFQILRRGDHRPVPHAQEVSCG